MGYDVRLEPRVDENARVVIEAADDVRSRLPESPRQFTVFDSLDEAMRKHLLEYGKNVI